LLLQMFQTGERCALLWIQDDSDVSRGIAAKLCGCTKFTKCTGRPRLITGQSSLLADFRPSTGGDDPRARLRGLRRRKQPHRAGHKEAKKPHRLLDPFDVRDNRDSLPAGEVFHPNLEVFPHRTRIISGEIRGGFMMETPDSASMTSLVSTPAISTCIRRKIRVVLLVRTAAPGWQSTARTS
jgi:hypothetical protein